MKFKQDGLKDISIFYQRI